MYLAVAGILIVACQQDAGKKSEVPETTPTILSPPTAQDAPDLVEGALFHDVEMAHLYPDSKTFADAGPKGNIEEIIRKYDHERPLDGDKLKAFVEGNFNLPASKATDYQSDKG